MNALKKIHDKCFKLICTFADDYWFYRTLRRAGFKAYCHTGIQVGHIYEKHEIIDYGSYRQFKALNQNGSTWIAKNYKKEVNYARSI